MTYLQACADSPRGFRLRRTLAFFQIFTLTSISSRDLQSISAWKLSLAKQFFHMASFWAFCTWKPLKQRLLQETRFSFVTSNR